MIRIIEIAPLENGAHNNQTYHGFIPKGWAVIPEDMELPSFPFGDVEAEEIDGVMTVTRWTEGVMPEVEPEVILEPKDLNAEVEKLRAENESLKQSITDLELAIVELYESTEV